MKYIKEYLCDKRTPSDEEIREGLKEELLSGKIVKLNFSDLSKLILNFPSEINTLMIQKSFDDYYITVDDITIRKEQERKAIKTKF